MTNIKLDENSFVLSNYFAFCLFFETNNVDLPEIQVDDGHNDVNRDKELEVFCFKSSSIMFLKFLVVMKYEKEIGFSKWMIIENDKA